MVCRIRNKFLKYPKNAWMINKKRRRQILEKILKLSFDGNSTSINFCEYIAVAKLNIAINTPKNNDINNKFKSSLMCEKSHFNFCFLLLLFFINISVSLQSNSDLDAHIFLSSFNSL